MTVYEASMKYKDNNIDTVIISGNEYGSGSSRDWAAKGTNLLGIKAVISDSFERIHRSNLVGMGVLPIELCDVKSHELNIKGKEIISIDLNNIYANKIIDINIDNITIKGKLRIDSKIEIEYYKSGGILNYVLNSK